MDTETKVIDVMEAVFARNERLAAELNEKFTARKIFCVNVLGGPGVGKTTSLEKMIAGLENSVRVIEGDIESDIDTQKLNALGISATQINTGGACHLDSPIVAAAFEKDFGGFENGFLFIENIGNLVCPAEFMIGEHVKLLVSSVTEGSDKPYKYPLAFERADVILLNKCDMLRYMDDSDFDIKYFLNGIKKLNPTAPVIQVSGKTGEGFDEAITWLTKKAEPVLS